MSTLRKRVTVPAAIVLALVVAPALTGCFSNPIEQIIEGATGGDVDLGGTSVPTGFPTGEVPLIDGEIQFGASLGNADGRVFNVTIKVAGGSPTEAITGQLEGAGFTTDAALEGATGGAGTLIYTSDRWGVLVVVAEDGGSWVVNYTVTEKTS